MPPGSEGDDNPNAGSRDGLPADVRAALTRLVDKNGGDANAVALNLYDDNHRLRTQRRALKSELDKTKRELEEAKKPATETTAALDAYNALGTVDELKAKLGKLTTLETADVTRTRAEAARTAATAVNWNPDTLAALAADKSLTISVKDETENGKTVKVAYVKPADAKAEDAPVKLTEYVNQHLAHYLPALTAKPSTTAAGTAGTTAANTTAAGTRTTYPAQRSGTETGTTSAERDPVATVITKKYPTPSERRAAAQKA